MLRYEGALRWIRISVVRYGALQTDTKTKTETGTKTESKTKTKTKTGPRLVVGILQLVLSEYCRYKL